MKKIILSVIFCLASSVFAFAQSPFPELDKIKQIKLLESTREDVKRIFREYQEDEEDNSKSEDDEITSDDFETENMSITFRYSLGNCSDDDNEEWNVSKGKVTEIEIILDENVKPKYLKIELNKLERINKNKGGDEKETDVDDYIYYDKGKGVSYELSDGEVENIKYTPIEKDFPALCNNETVGEYISQKEWLIEKIKDRSSRIICGRPFANVTDLILSKNEFTPDCPASNPNEPADSEYAKITIEAKGVSSDPTDILSFNYQVSGGKIIGSGENIIWDLSGIKPGQYTITAIADNGCGMCGTTRTETVTVKDYPDCSQKPK